MSTGQYCILKAICITAAALKVSKQYYAISDRSYLQVFYILIFIFWCLTDHSMAK